LLSSGVTLTTAHRAILANKKTLSKLFLLQTLFYGLFFTSLQFYEYVSCSFNINDSVYGSIFFLSTGFHGLHVIIGTIFLLFCYILMQKRYYTTKRHLSFECAAYY
jgi:heme/copper-type cytochrome/quinol oxidase subunit 3